LVSNTEKYKKYKPKKFLGQNFLVDDNIARKISRTVEFSKDDFVLEIGPGHGALTRYFTDYGDNYAAVEIDKSAFENLKEKYPKVNFIHKDFLKLDFIKDIPVIPSGNIKVIGNIPYNITSEILFKLFDNRDYIHSAVLMVQKEVAQRLIAISDTKEYGILAVQTQANCIPKILFSVPPTAFFPKPRVNSSVIKLDFRTVSFEISNYEHFRLLVRNAFGKRRKTIRNSLMGFFEEKGLSFADFDFDFSRRAENLKVHEYIMLSQKITKLLG